MTTYEEGFRTVLKWFAGTLIFIIIIFLIGMVLVHQGVLI